ncbi:MAG: PEP-CTERM sorting domain-containing protein [Phycisphaerales bacterium]|nr:MAG: PEP-CTERM sorting domain-containing protein [Phycisphaerales bacterium]
MSALVFLTTVPAGAVPLEYLIEGTARYQEGPDTTLDGASLSIVMGIDCEAEPFDGIPNEVAGYHFDEGSGWLSIAGTVGSDGTYPGSGGIWLWDQDGFMTEAIGIYGSQFVIPGTEVYAFSIFMEDCLGMVQALDSVAVPTSIDLDAFSGHDSRLRVMTEAGSVNGYLIDDVAITITVIPEPSSLALLVLGVVVIVGRRADRQ